MRDVVRRVLEAGLGTSNAERVEELADGLIERSRQGTERLVSVVQRQMRRQMRLAGAATQDELRELRKRVRTLERRLEEAEKGSGRRAASSTSSSSRKRTAARSSTSRSKG